MKGAEVALLWGQLGADELSGSMLKLPAGFAGTLMSEGSDFKAVTIQGQLEHRVDGLQAVTTLPAGGYFGSNEGVEHSLICDLQSECLLYIRTARQFKVR